MQGLDKVVSGERGVIGCAEDLSAQLGAQKGRLVASLATFAPSDADERAAATLGKQPDRQLEPEPEPELQLIPLAPEPDQSPREHYTSPVERLAPLYGPDSLQVSPPVRAMVSPSGLPPTL